MKKLLALAGTLLLLILNIVQVKGFPMIGPSKQIEPISLAESIAIENCGGSGHGSSDAV